MSEKLGNQTDKVGEQARLLNCDPQTAAFVIDQLGDGDIHRGGSGLKEAAPGDAAGFTGTAMDEKNAIVSYGEQFSPRGIALMNAQRTFLSKAMEGAPLTAGDAPDEGTWKDQGVTKADMLAVAVRMAVSAVSKPRGLKVHDISGTNQLNPMNATEGDKTIAMGHALLANELGSSYVVETAVAYGPSVADPESPTGFRNGEVLDFMVTTRRAAREDLPWQAQAA